MVQTTQTTTLRSAPPSLRPHKKRLKGFKGVTCFKPTASLGRGGGFIGALKTLSDPTSQGGGAHAPNTGWHPFGKAPGILLCEEEGREEGTGGENPGGGGSDPHGGVSDPPPSSWTFSMLKKIPGRTPPPFRRIVPS